MSEWPAQTVVEVAEGVLGVIQGRGEAGVSNAGIVLDANEALVVDTFMFPEMAAVLVEELARRDARARLVVNTHHHIDHIGGNAAFAGTPLLAHPEAVHTIERTGHPAAVYDAFMPAFAGRFAEMPLAPPEGSAIPTGLPRDAEIRPYSPAHTPGDLAAWLPSERVLFTGDLCFFGVTPLAIQGLLSSWVGALDDLASLDPAVVVPGHGPVGSVEDVIVVRDHLSALLAAGRAAVEAGVGLDEAAAEFDPGPVGDWIEGERTLVNLERAMQEAAGTIDAASLDPMPPSFGRLLA